MSVTRAASPSEAMKFVTCAGGVTSGSGTPETGGADNALSLPLMSTAVIR